MTRTSRYDHRGTLLALLHDRGALARAELAQESGLSGATVRRVVDVLRRAGYVHEIVGPGEGPGRPPWMVELVPGAAHVVGLDAGASLLRAVLVDLDGTVRARAAHPARDPGNATALVEDLVAVAREVVVAAEGRRILAVAAGISGIVDHDAGRVRMSPDLPGLAGVDVASALGAALGVPVTIDNDDLLAAVGEVAAGAARGARNAVFLSLGYGLGAGIVANGQPWRGAAHAAGAVAFIGSPPLDERVSGRAVASRYVAALARSGMTDRARLPASPDARWVFERAEAGDPIARGLVADVVSSIADLAVVVAAVVDPEVIVLGGGIAANGEVVLRAVEERLGCTLPYPPRVVQSTLEGGAVVHGAAAVALSAAWTSLPASINDAAHRAGGRRTRPDPDTASAHEPTDPDPGDDMAGVAVAGSH